jgi:quercetin dioxygenase-like cupin family protein
MFTGGSVQVGVAQVASETNPHRDVTPGTDRGWTANAPPSIAFTLDRADGQWRSVGGVPDALEYREVGLDLATRGLLGARHVRVAGTAPDPQLGWHHHDLDFSFVFVLAGTMRVEEESGGSVELSRTDVAMPPAGARQRVSLSADFQALVMIAPGDWDRFAVAEPDDRAAGRGWWTGSPRYLRDGEQAFERRGLRRFFEYRDLETVEPSGGRLGVTVIRAVEASSFPEGTGWHYHSMGQLVVVLSGTAEVSIGGHGTVITGQYDSMCVGAGVVHNVYSFTDDYSLIEFCVPAAYDTVAMEPV